MVYGHDPHALHSYEQGDACVPTVDTVMADRDSFLVDVHERLLRAQEYAKHYYNANHRDVSFQVGDSVWLRLSQRLALSLSAHTRGKLISCYFGPYQVSEHFGEVVYCLLLPPGAYSHDVFHVGLLKAFHGEPMAAPPSLPELSHGRALPTPEKAIKGRLHPGTW